MSDNVCGTAGCFAGWRAMLDGWTVVKNQIPGLTPMMMDADGEVTYADEIGDYARDRLELTRDESRDLFDPDNGLAKLKHPVDALCAQSGRSEESKLLLQETMDQVVAVKPLGLWVQMDWITVLDGDRS